MKLSEFHEGQSVIYIPGYAKGNRQHPDCERGVVSTVGFHNVFVKFNEQVSRLGWLGATSRACDPDSLEKA
jgi:hypothetical protein